MKGLVERAGAGVGSVRARRFDALYTERIDPWDFRTSDYERTKYRATLAALPRARYRWALEIGCSIGELSRALAGRAREVLGLDVSSVAIEEARRAHAEVPGLRFETAEVPMGFPVGTFDLVVLSEVLYFLDPAEIDATAARVADALVPGGQCLTVCWLGETDAGTDLGGDEAGERFAGSLTGRGHVVRDVSSCRREPNYRLDLFTRDGRDSWPDGDKS